jgi:general secretion pathway protein M
MSALQTWWQGRNRRERIMVSVMLAAIAAFLAWYGVLSPLRQARDAAQARYLRAAAALEETDAALALLAEPRNSPPVARGQAYAEIIVDSAGAAGVAIARRDADADGGLVLGIDGVAANTLFAWLDALREKHGVAPIAIEIDKRDGRLRAELRFAPPP